MKCWEVPLNEQPFPMHFKMILNLEFTYDDSQLEYHLNKRSNVLVQGSFLNNNTLGSWFRSEFEYIGDS